MNNRKILIKITILLAGYGLYSDAIVVPLVTLIFTEFPDSSTFLQNFIITGPALIGIPISLITGKLAQYISKKYLLIFGFVLYLIGGIGGAYANSMEYLAIMRAFSGAAAGLIGVLALSLISEIYTDVKERGNVMGWYNAVSAVCGSIMSILAGIIALNSWRNAFYINGFAVVSLLLIIFFLPKTPPEGKKYQQEVTSKDKKYPFKSMSAILISVLFISTLYCVIYYCIDLYVSEKGLGTSALSGTLTAIGTIASLSVSIFFGIIYIRVRRFLPVIFYLATSISFIILSFTNSHLVVLILCGVAGGAFALSISYYSMLISEIVPESKMSISMSLYMAIHSISMFISPYVPFVIQKILKVETISGSFTYIGIILAIGGALSLILKNKLIRINKIN